MNRLKRIVRFVFSDYAAGWWAGGAYWTWGLTWRSVAVILIVIVAFAAVQVAVKE